MAIGWFIAGSVLFIFVCVLCCCRMAKQEDEYMGIDEDSIPPTSEPMPEPMKTWVSYSVPLSDEIQRYVYELCQQYGVRPALVYAIIENESDYQTDALSSDGYDFGLMQIRSICHTERCVRLGAWNLFDAKSNVRVGIDYLAELLEQESSDDRTREETELWALAKYHGDSRPGDYSMGVLADAQWLEETSMIMEGK